jgi:hypothetical protein
MCWAFCRSASVLATAENHAAEAATVFRNFDDLWQPFTLGAGPVPGYCVSLSPKARRRLKDIPAKLKGAALTLS